MAHSAHRHALLAAGCLAALFLPPIARGESDLESCAQGSQGADATGNDCGSIERVSLAHRAAHPVHKPLVLKVSAPVEPKRAATAPQAKAPAQAPRLEASNDCAAGASGVDSTGNECNSIASTR